MPGCDGFPIIEPNPVTLEEVLSARDRRVLRQHEMLKQAGCPLISVTLNMPGPVKRTPLSHYFFERELRNLNSLLKSLGATIVLEEKTSAVTGDEALIAIDGFAPSKIKSLAVALEKRAEASRLLDLDVLCEDGTAVNRESLGLTARRCLLCAKPAFFCAASRMHSGDALEEKVRLLLDHYARKNLTDAHAAMALEASSFELMVSPKPGLVTFCSAGSHDDMDRFTFVKSQSVLAGYYRASFQMGWTPSFPPTERAMRFRHEGMLAEQAMVESTNGVNTHRGWIYLSGILLAAMGEYWRETLSADEAIPTREQSGKLSEPADKPSKLSRYAAGMARELEESLHSVYHFSSLNQRLNGGSLLSGIREEAS
ncbi:MAG TPA: citrate lyase holo-[acyl-carrier protein] synthase, partial [Clostridia bacterium]|nr:citrate lyase holo-[acyl-carrier protein] synthase [Clostridia bacterium]